MPRVAFKGYLLGLSFVSNIDGVRVIISARS